MSASNRRAQGKFGGGDEIPLEPAAAATHLRTLRRLRHRPLGPLRAELALHPLPGTWLEAKVMTDPIRSLMVKTAQARSAMLTDLLIAQLTDAGLPEPKREFLFAKPRRWRFDLAWPELYLAVEIEGGSWTAGAHVRGKHFRSDVDKYNTATLYGWRLLRVTPEMIESSLIARDLIRSVFDEEARASVKVEPS